MMEKHETEAVMDASLWLDGFASRLTMKPLDLLFLNGRY